MDINAVSILTGKYIKFRNKGLGRKLKSVILRFLKNV
jgi:hypothetical protein